MRNFRFEFVIDGDGVSPYTVSVRDLFDVVSNLEAAMAITAREGGASVDDDLLISLVDIGTGSDKLTCAVSDKMFKAAGIVSHAIHTRDFSNVPISAHQKLYNLQRKAQKSNWSLGFRATSGGVIAKAVITPDDELLRPPRVEGRTTLFGRCDKPGGERPPSARVTLLTGEKITVQLKNKSLAKEIGIRLFEVVGLEGVASWNSEKWSLEAFKVERLTDYKETDPLTAFRLLAESAGTFWDDIDPDLYVRELRAD